MVGMSFDKTRSKMAGKTTHVLPTRRLAAEWDDERINWLIERKNERSSPNRNQDRPANYQRTKSWILLLIINIAVCSTYSFKYSHCLLDFPPTDAESTSAHQHNEACPTQPSEPPTAYFLPPAPRYRETRDLFANSTLGTEKAPWREE